MILKDILINIGQYDFSGSKSNKTQELKDTSAFKKLNRRLEPQKKSRQSFSRRKISKNQYSGAYLVTGYEGMGKTTLVDGVIKNINQKRETVKKINVPLSRENLSYFDILNQIFVHFNSEIQRKRKKFLPERRFRTAFVLFTSLAILHWLEGGGSFNFTDLLKIESGDVDLVSLLRFSLFYIAISLVVRTVLNLVIYQAFRQRIKFYNKIEEISRRLNANLEYSSIQVKNESYTGLTSGSSFLNRTLSAVREQISPFKQVFDKLTAKELEFEIREALRLYKKSVTVSGIKRCKKHIVFVLDELDKLENNLSDGDDYFDLGKSKSESQKEQLKRILVNLKSFLNTADAKFVFIGGADMYDASLADIADRESFYSGIFKEVIYVSSFFKSDNYSISNTGLDGQVKDYLHKIMGTDPKQEWNDLEPKLLPANRIVDLTVNQNENYKIKFQATKGSIDSGDFSMDINLIQTENGINNLSFKRKKRIIEPINEIHLKLLTSVSNDVTTGIQTIIKHFVTYLTYRTNGSPKKLNELTEYYLVQEKEIREELHFYHRSKQNCKNESLKCTYLRFTPLQQYKFGLLHSIFGPFLNDSLDYRKNLNDKNLFLSAYMMDHILKFHKSAFSWNQMELLPDIILGSKGPNLRNTIQFIIDQLSELHIKETTNAVFQYKFRSETANELKYISKISDESAAAFNFTYDESYSLKAYFKRKLKQKIERQKEQVNSKFPGAFDHTISFLNTTIADLHYYDEEYDSAIRYYADAIQPLRDAIIRSHSLTSHQQIILQRNRLFLSLCLEKTKRYDSTYSLLRTTIIHNHNIWENDLARISYPIFGESHLDYWESPFKRMQLFLRPHLALLMVYEKDRSDGITMDNLKRNITEYCQFLGVEPLFPAIRFDPEFKFESFKRNEIIKADHKRIQTLLADYYQSVGSILFYKNRNFEELEKEMIAVKDHFNLTISVKNDLNQKIPPTYSSLVYYLISLNHLLIPYSNNENLAKTEDGKGNLFANLSYFAQSQNGLRLSSKENELIGLVLSKLSDNILAVLDEFGDLSKEYKFDNLDTELSNMQPNNVLSIISESPFASIENFFKLTFLSSKFFENARNTYEVDFQIKKCIYLIWYLNKVSKRIESEIIESFFIGLFNNHFNANFKVLDRVKEELFNKPEKINEILEELVLLKEINEELVKYKDESLLATNPFNTSAYSKALQLHLDLSKYSSKVEQNNSRIEALRIIILLYPSCFKLGHILKKEMLETITGIKAKNGSYEWCENKAQELEKRAYQLHSEGSEYKHWVKNTYLLEDDLNDLSEHFFAAFERLKINNPIS